MPLFLIQFVAIVTIGGILGSFLGSVVSRSRVVAGVSLQFFEFAQWMPLLAIWALPLWPPRAPYVYALIFLICALSCLVVIISTIHKYVTLGVLLDLSGHDLRRNLIRDILLKSFLVCLISQIWLQPYGWHWYAMYEPNSTRRLIGNLALLVIGLSFINYAVRLDFDDIAERRRVALQKEGSIWTAVSMLVSLLLLGLCILVWYLLSDFLNSLLGLLPFVDVFTQFVFIMSSLSSTMLDTGHSVGFQLVISLAEILIGVFVAAGLAFGLTNFSDSRPGMRNVLKLLVPYTYVIPVLASLFVLGWPVPLRIVFGVTLISVFPCMEVMWRSTKSLGLRCIPMAIAEALPFAYLGMFFGEAMFSTVGVYLLMILSRAQRETASTAFALAMIVVLSFLLLSYAFHWVAYQKMQQERRLRS